MKRKQRILIVDDDQMNLEIMKEILGDNYSMALAESGYEALEILPKFSPDLILLDIMMPGMDGYEVCRKIRADKQYCFTKIILVSGKAMVKERLEGYSAGVDDYICKPFVNEELEAKIRVFLKLKHVEEIDQLKNDLLLLISHEIRTPLNGIIGLSQILMDDKSSSEDQKQMLSMIIKDGYLLLDFFQKAKTLVSLKKGLELHKSSGLVKEYIELAIAALEKSAAKKGITFQLDVDDKLTCYADWQQIYPVLGYILDNAVKYSPDGGLVTIKVEKRDKMDHIQISDQGEGIKEGWVDKIFDEFAVRDIVHHQKGQGLSLAISRYVTEFHGGTIEAAGTPGQGAVFTIRLPNKI